MVYKECKNADTFEGASHETLVSEGYTATRLMQDEGFERGFYVAKYDQTRTFLNHGTFRDYCTTDEKPLWGIAPWWVGYDLYENRDKTTDKYTLKDDKEISTIIYNPEEKSVSMRLDATKVFNGLSYDKYIESGGKWWPHLLVEQARGVCPFDKERNTAAGDRMFVEVNVRIPDYKHTVNPEGSNVCGYFIYFYLKSDKDPEKLIWFGLDLLTTLSASENRVPSWSRDSAARQFMYKIPMAEVYDGIENSFNPEKDVVAVGNEWKHVRLDVTRHIETAVEWANRDKAFDAPITKKDMFFAGVNIGFEIWGNIDCTVEFKNFNMISYNKGE